MENDFFPQGLALGANFCNRIPEQERIKNNIQSARSTLVMSPRRYGKTSLVMTVLHEAKHPFVNMDLYSELNEQEIQNTILSSVGDILYSIESLPKKALKFVTDFFSDFNVSFKLANNKIQVEFSRSKKSPAKIILETLKKLDEVLNKKNKKAILFFDEFQRISQISEAATIEGSVRHVAQESKNIVFIFSGSNRNLLSKMFDDRTKPLYKLCDRIMLNRISNEHYIPFIQEKSQQKWGKSIPENIIDALLNITERHPYYVNVLCHRLWQLIKMPSTEEDISSAWHQYAIEEKSNVLGEIELLSKNQAKMLIGIAKYGNDLFPMSQEFISLTKFSLSSASQAIQALKKMDYVYINDEKKYCIVDPLIKYIYSSL